MSNSICAVFDKYKKIFEFSTNEKCPIYSTIINGKYIEILEHLNKTQRVYLLANGSFKTVHYVYGKTFQEKFLLFLTYCNNAQNNLNYIDYFTITRSFDKYKENNIIYFWKRYKYKNNSSKILIIKCIIDVDNITFTQKQYNILDEDNILSNCEVEYNIITKSTKRKLIFDDNEIINSTSDAGVSNSASITDDIDISNANYMSVMNGSNNPILYAKNGKSIKVDHKTETNKVLDIDIDHDHHRMMNAHIVDHKIMDNNKYTTPVKNPSKLTKVANINSNSPTDCFIIDDYDNNYADKIFEMNRINEVNKIDEANRIYEVDKIDEVDTQKIENTRIDILKLLTEKKTD